MFQFKVATVLSFICYLSLLGPTPVMPQEGINSSSLSGHIGDPNSASVSGAVVTVRNLETNKTQSTVTDANGRFRFGHLNVGSYEVEVRKQNFARLLTHVNLLIAQSAELN